MKILLHICCGPCSTVAIERLLQENFEITGFFYNPNIYPEEEYELRLKNAEIVALKNNISFLPSIYEPEEWHKKIRGYEKEKEGGERCKLCIKMRLAETAKKAKDSGFETFGTTLTTGLNKNSKRINLYGANVSFEIGIPFHLVDFKKNAGFQRSVVLSKEMGLYRQRYCGCIYSLRSTPTYSSE
ncbi:MAG: epoxyqueuosine reductase QueH [bacterium]